MRPFPRTHKEWPGQPEIFPTFGEMAQRALLILTFHQGDSGSAFVTSDGIVRGLLAAGAFGCGTEDAEIFTDVHMHWHWIKRTINGNGTVGGYIQTICA